MRYLHRRRDSAAALISMGLMSAMVVVAFTQTSSASAAESMGTQSESFAMLMAAPGAAPHGAPALPAGPVTAASSSEDIAALQTSLSMAGQQLTISGTLDEQSVKALRIFQAKNHLREADEANANTLEKLAIIDRDGVVDPRCMQPGIVLCVDKAQKVVRYFKDGQVQRVIDVNIGPEKWDDNFGQYSSTRVGSHKIFRKDEDAVSSDYGYSMPYFMQFDGGIGFHQSTFFGETGYKDTSMGCVTIADKADAKWLFDNTPLKSTVVVYA